MLWHQSKNKRWTVAFLKSFLAVFMLQILVSAACISTAEANTAVRVAPVTAHCHNISHSDFDVPDANHHALPCAHCDTPDLALSTHAPVMSDTVAVLLAVIVLPHVAELATEQNLDFIAAASPPDSTTLLYHTTRRILI